MVSVSELHAVRPWIENNVFPLRVREQAATEDVYDLSPETLDLLVRYG